MCRNRHTLNTSLIPPGVLLLLPSVLPLNKLSSSSSSSSSSSLLPFLKFVSYEQLRPFDVLPHMSLFFTTRRVLSLYSIGRVRETTYASSGGTPPLMPAEEAPRH